MSDLILQWIYLPVTVLMFGLEALGRAVVAGQSSAGTETSTQSQAGQSATATSTPAGPGVKPVSYHPNAAKN